MKHSLSNLITGINYIIPIWNWSLRTFLILSLHSYHYIIPIWNWSCLIYIVLLSSLVNYIIPIWNWSDLLTRIFQNLSSITLFLYGIGASNNPLKYTPPLIITLFLYGIGAVKCIFHKSPKKGLHYSYMELELYFYYF